LGERNGPKGEGDNVHTDVSDRKQGSGTPDKTMPVDEPLKSVNGSPPQPQAPTRLSLSRTFAALKYPNYRLWFMGQLASLVGTWMQSTAQGYLVFELTRSPAYLGYVGFAGGIPSWVLMLYGGVVTDRMSKRTLLILTQSAMMILAFILAALTFAGWVQAWHIIVLALLLGVANAFDAPARQAFVLEMVEREDMANAIALNSMMFNSATAVGPAVAGVTYALVGPAWCFTFNGVSFIAVIVALMLMHIKPHELRVRTTSALYELREGLSYVASHEVIRALILLALLVSLFGMGYVTLIPAWAVNILGGDATTTGLMQSARGVGSVLAAFMIASLGRFRWKGKLMTVGTFVFPVLLLVLAAVRAIPLALLVLVGMGWGFMVVFNMLNTLIQALVSDRLRGRVMGIYSLTFFGSMPIGALLAGGMADRIGEPQTVTISALLCISFALVIAWRMPRLRALE
jgi:predicted MFS family arabinose efflux permease